MRIVFRCSKNTVQCSARPSGEGIDGRDTHCDAGFGGDDEAVVVVVVAMALANKANFEGRGKGIGTTGLKLKLKFAPINIDLD